MKKLSILIFATLILVSSCKESNKANFTPASIGQVNSLTVVMSNSLWEGKVGDKVRELFAASVLGIAWSEPRLSLRHMPDDVFTGQIRKTRSVLFVQQKDTTDLAYIKTDLYARPQKVAIIIGATEDALVETIATRAEHIISTFKETDMKVTQNNFLRSLNDETDLREEFGITMNIPSVYKVGKREPNFVWLDRDIKKGTMNLMVYTLPEDAFDNDSTFVGDIVRKRDSIAKIYVPGPNEGTYMVTEKAFAPYVFPTEIGGKKAAEVRGRWEIHNYAMAGPYVSYIINDKENKRKLVIEGFTFAPAAIKRDFMFELEAIIKTLKFIPKVEQ